MLSLCVYCETQRMLWALFAHPPGCHCQILGPIDYSSEFSSDVEMHVEIHALSVPESGRGHLLCL